MSNAQSWRHPTTLAKAVPFGALMTVAACAVGPTYQPPAVAPAPDAFKEVAAAPPGTWVPAQPGDEIARGEWWKRLGDPQLDTLESHVDVSSQTLQQAEAQYRQSRALVRADRAAYYPTVTVSPSITTQRVSTNRSNQVIRSVTTTDYSLPLDASYEADVWGRVRQTVAASRAAMQASAADLESVRLSVHAEVATDYLQLRALDAEIDLLDSTVAALDKAWQLTQNRYQAGVASRGDVVQAQAQLESTRTQAIDLAVQRAQFEDAIAVLVGQLPSTLTLAPAPLGGEPPIVPLTMPSELLQRRPDVAAAERHVAEANARLGVASAAFFPSILLSATAGFQSSQFSDWLSWPSRFWSLGPSLVQTLFDGGARRAARDEARAAYDQSVAAYRQSVLTAFQDVEDNLAALRILAEEARTQDVAVDASRQSLQIALNQYSSGFVSYLQVVTAQSAALSNERAAVDIRARRYMATVQLVKALGGGWEVSKLPSQ
jgi:NodT family efflux transporter outer membrane factor (OMF) lipoprotein